MSPTTRARWWSGLSVALLLVIVWACGEEKRQRAGDDASLRITLHFPEGAARRGGGDEITRVRAIAFELRAGADPIQVGFAQDDIEPGETRYSIALAVPPADGILVDVEVWGRHHRTGGRTGFGTIYFGSGALFGIESGESRDLTIELDDVVPDLTQVESDPSHYRLAWNAVEGAVGYALSESTEAAGMHSFEVAGLDTTFAFPPSLRGLAGSAGAPFSARYRVGALLPRAHFSAESESIDVRFPPPTPPEAILDLSAQSVSDSSAILIWTAPSDGGEEAVTSYDVRMSGSEITAANFALAEVVPNAQNPNVPGAQEGLFVQGLAAGTSYWFAIVSRDDVGLDSPLSNVLQIRTLDQLDRTDPGPVEDLEGLARGETDVLLRWVAPGDDGSVGQVAGYEIRYATFALSDENFEQGTLAEVAPRLSAAGEIDSVRIGELTRETEYYFNLRARDEAGNLGPLNKGAHVILPDLTAPNAIRTLAERGRSSSSIHLTWTAPGDDGQFGTAWAYDLRRAESPISLDNFEDATVIETSAPRESGSQEAIDVVGLAPRGTYYFALKSRDESGNVSALSNVIRATTTIEAPSDLLSNLPEPRTITLSWTFARPDPDGFLLERHAEGEFATVAVIEGGERGYADQNLAPSTLYTYRVRAFEGADTSDYSGENALSTSEDEALCELLPDTLSYGMISVGDGDTLRFVIRNAGSGVLSGEVGGSCQSFTILNPQSYSLGGGEELEIAVEFAPREVLDYDCEIPIGGCGLSLRCLGLGDGPPVCRLSTAALDFGDVPVGQAGLRAYEIENIGGGTLSGNVALFNCTDYSILNGRNYSIGRLGSHTVTISFAPNAPGAQDCEIANGTGPECPNLSASGNGVVCVASPDTVEFGSIAVGTFVSNSFTVTNLSDTSWTFQLSNPGNNCGAFAIGTQDQAFPLAPEQSRTITLRFGPQQSGLFLCDAIVSFHAVSGGPTIQCSQVVFRGSGFSGAAKGD